MTPFRVHIIHVGSMQNKGVQALLQTDISCIKRIMETDVIFSVSAGDAEGVQRHNPDVKVVLPRMVDIPYERADSHAKRLGYRREQAMYKVLMVAYGGQMLLQVFLSVLSAWCIKAGLKPVYRSEVLEKLKCCDLVVSYSNENFKEGLSLVPSNVYWLIIWWSMLISRTWEVLIAKFLGKPVLVFPNSVGPFRTLIGRVIARLALNRCDCILVRESVSERELCSLGITSPHILTSDIVLLYEPRNRMTGRTTSVPILGVSPGFYSNVLSEREKEAYLTAHAVALDTAVEKYGLSVVFLPHYVTGFRLDDLEICELIFHRMKNKDRARIENFDSVEEFASFLDRTDVLISSKMHPAVLAIRGHVPTICVAYDQKQIGLFEQLAMSNCILPIGDLSPEKLVSKIDYVWNRRENMKRVLQTSVPKLQKDAVRVLKRALNSVVGASQGRKTSVRARC